MSTEKFTTLTSKCLPFNQNNVDTDQIIPARFLKVTTKAGLGDNLFYDLRYNDDGSEKGNFILNQSQYKGSKILVAPHNFGCGSSREHAPWSLVDYGFRAMIAVSFADIFKNNSLKNGLLPVELPEAVVTKLLDRIEENPDLEITIDLPNQQVLIPDEQPQSFEVDAFRKTCLTEGLDDIGYTLKHTNAIETYETAHA